MKTLRTICFAIIATIAMVNARAQYSIDMKQPQLENYRSMSYSLKLSEVCEALETDTASFAADFYDFKNYPKLVTLESDDHSTNYTQGDGDKAYILRVNFNTTESNPDDEPLDFASQTKAGSQDIVVNEWPNGNYKAWNVAIDIDSIAELLGCKKSDIKLRAEMSEGVISFNTTANNGGYWIDKDGFVCTWGQGSVLAVEPSSGLSTLYCMQMPGVVQVGEVYTYRMYLVGKRAYYQLNFTINIGEQPTFDFSEYALAAEEMYEFQIVPGDGDWNNEHMQEGIPLGAEHLSELLGDGSYTFLGEVQTDDGRVLVTDEYTCDPHPAFWMTGSYVHAHNGQNSYGILYTANDAKFQFVKQPGFNQVGESYVGNFWLANPETKKYIHYTIYIEYVDEIVNYVTVGNESLELPCNGKEGDYAETPVDMSKCLNALGCDLDQFAEAGQWKVRNSKGKFTSEGYEDEMYGFWFDAEGNPTTDEEAKCYAIEFLDQDASDCGENCFRTYAFTNGTYNAVICAEYYGNRYIFNVVISSDSADGIDTVADDTMPKSKRGIYNLAGQRVTSLQHGLYIVDGKKVYVK